MRQLATLVAWIAPVMVVAPMALAQCGGDDATQIISPDGGKQGSGSSSGGGSGSSSGGTNPGDDATTTPEPDGTAPVGDGGTPVTGDGGADGSTTTTIPVPEGGAPSDPGSVVCNGAPCAVSSGSTCCYAKTDAGSSEVCNPPNTGCSTQTITCNEASDCNGGVCCWNTIGVAVQASTFCTPPGTKTCPTGAMYPLGTFQICRTDAECGQDSDAGALKRCIPQLCTSPTVMMNATPNMLTIQACAKPTTMANDAGTQTFCKPL